ncbi:hypothetical protein SEPCBS57363_001165 [Sporothrix epigloea]|uniref:F-box domain-containing protein n=1 Tax=Sporothrix epigloea TaxID=1892477 RepID=A0ABP0DCJ8_9PEZI
MHHELPEASEHVPLHSSSKTPSFSAQHGPDRPQPDISADHAVPQQKKRAALPAAEGVDAQKLEEELSRLSGRRQSLHSPTNSKSSPTAVAASPSLPAVAGQRVAEYERARTPASLRRDRVVFRIVKKTSGAGPGRSLNDIPNEVLTHIFSYLQPGTHDAVALVSKRFYALITTPHAWRMAFSRFFPGQEAATLNGTAVLLATGAADTPETENSLNMLAHRADARRFGRLAALASWRSEYLQRTRLLRSLISGKPGVSVGVKGEGPGSKAVGSHGKRATAVITYNSQLPAAVDHLHAVFASSGKKQPRVIHGSSKYGVVTASDPSLGKLEGWGYREAYVAPQLEDIDRSLTPYGLGTGRAAMPNVMDVSQIYGAIVGEGFPGGRVLTRAKTDHSLTYLNDATRIRRFVLPDMTDTAVSLSEVPAIPEAAEAVCSVWVAKSTAVPTVTKSMIGFLTGSTLGVVSAYSLDKASSSSRYPYSQITARWVLCPGVPIIMITADDSYTEKRRTGRRIWAVALNALGEVYYLRDVPMAPTATAAVYEDKERLAWQAGRTVSWELIEASRRTVTADWFDNKVESLCTAASSSPRLSSNAVGLEREQRIAESREIERYFDLLPEHFRAVYDSWDMRLKLLVDFAGGGSNTAENVVVVRSGSDQRGQRLPQSAKVTRYTRLVAAVVSPPASPDSAPAKFTSSSPPGGSDPTLQLSTTHTGGPDTFLKPTLPKPVPTPASDTNDISSITAGDEIPQLPGIIAATLDWQVTNFSLKGNTNKKDSGKASPDTEISCSALDMSLYSVVAPFEDVLLLQQVNGVQTTLGEIPGRRARWMAVGTKSGVVLVWNMREAVSSSLSSSAAYSFESLPESTVWPMRIIRTNSPSVTSVGVSALYLVHGGSDGLVQAWDPLASTAGPVRTLNAPSAGRIPRHLTHLRGVLTPDMFASVGSIFLDPDPTVLRGVLSVGTLLRFWSYSAAIHAASRKKGRRLRHTNADGQLVKHRLTGEKVDDYIAAEAAELRREQESDAINRARLLRRFGVGLAGLTDDEALRYAEILSQETFTLDEQRYKQLGQLSGSESCSADDSTPSSGFGSSFISEEIASLSGSSADTVTPEPSTSGRSPTLASSSAESGFATPAAAIPAASAPSHSPCHRITHGGTSVDRGIDKRPTSASEEDDFELQIQRAIRLSLMEGVNMDASNEEDEFKMPTHTPDPPAHDHTQGKGKGKGRDLSTMTDLATNASSPSLEKVHRLNDSCRFLDGASSSASILPEHHVVGDNEEDDLQLALQLSLKEVGGSKEITDQLMKNSFLEQYENDAALAAALQDDEFPALQVQDVGKGKGKER